MGIIKVGRNKAFGIDGLADAQLKPLSDDIPFLVKLTNSYNNWIARNKIPDYAKTARVITISKTNSCYPPYGSIRPIAILPTTLKIFEIIVLKRMEEEMLQHAKPLNPS